MKYKIKWHPLLKRFIQGCQFGLFVAKFPKIWPFLIPFGHKRKVPCGQTISGLFLAICDSAWPQAKSLAILAFFWPFSVTPSPETRLNWPFFGQFQITSLNRFCEQNIIVLLVYLLQKQTVSSTKTSFQVLPFNFRSDKNVRPE